MAVNTINQYRVTFILDTRGVAGTVDSFCEELATILKGFGCEISQMTNHGTRYFSRASQNSKQNSGVYVQYVLSAGPEVHAKVNEKFRLDNRVDRVIVERV
jgi:ribosomal protein S6